MKNIQVIINPAAGKFEPILPVINETLKDTGIKWEVSVTKKAGDAAQMAKAAADAKVDAVAVYGGDGTLMEVMSALLESDIPLVILPGGSANVLAKELGIPKDLKEACALIKGPSDLRSIDLGQFGKRNFGTQISLGFAAEMVKGTGRESKNKFGIWAYALSTMEALKKIKLARYQIKIDGEEHTVDGITCLIANAGNLGFSKISFDKNIDISDGLLDVVVVRKANISLYKHLITTLIKRERPDNLELVKHWQGKEISVSANRKQIVQCDGEMLEKIPPRIRIVPSAIRVVVPKKETKLSPGT